LPSLFPATTEPVTTQEVLLAAEKMDPAKRPRHQPTVKVLETVTERNEPVAEVCAHCGQAKSEIGSEKSKRFEYIASNDIRHEIFRPKFACPCGESGVSIAPAAASD